MKNPAIYIIGILLLPVALMLSSCEKDEEADNPADPSDLVVEVLSIDTETFNVVIQAEANNAIEYRFFVDSDEVPEEINTSGLFEYTFEEGGIYQVEVRAYGPSDRYIKTVKEVNVSGEAAGIPLGKGYFSPMEYDGYYLIWQDEFNGSAVNTSNWGYDLGNGCPDLCGWGNNELEYYRSENTSVSDSVLIIEARKESFGSNDYTSARLVSRGKFAFRYGRVDIRALLPEGQGIWPALWMLGSNNNTVGWPKSGEIDIMEMIGGSESTTHGTLHWHDGEGHASAGQGYTVSNESLAEAYHVFSIIWDESSIQWLVDNVMFNEISITDPQMSEFHQEFWFIMNVAVGGNWPGNPDATTVFPQQMKVDYIRVFQSDGSQ